MTTTTTTPKIIDLSDSTILQWLAATLNKVQRQRRQPKRPGRLHRV